jgi:hypothetical protein
LSRLSDLDALIASLIEPTYSFRQAVEFFPREHKWLDRGLEAQTFKRDDGAPVIPARLPNGYRRFSLRDIRDIAVSARNRGTLTPDEFREVVRSVLYAAKRETGKAELPS